MEKIIKTIDNISIYMRYNIPQNAKIAVLVIHGLAEHSGRYQDLINGLAENQIAAFAMDIRGHGQSTGIHGDIQGIYKVFNDIDCVVKEIKAMNFVKFGIFGHSMGGLFASLYASLYKDKVDFLVLTSPAIYTPDKYKIINFIPYNLLHSLKIKKRHNESQALMELDQQDAFALHSYSIRTIGVMFHQGGKALKKYLNITCPTFLAYGEKDYLLSNKEEFTNFFNKINNSNKKIVCYPESKHRIVHNINADAHINDIIEWIKCNFC